MRNGEWAWAMSPARYVHEAVSNCKIHLPTFFQNRHSLPKEAQNPLTMGYDPELDTSPVVDPDAASYYLTVIDILRRMVELGRIDIITELSLLSSHIALPTEGHLEAAVHVMAHFGQKNNFKLVYDSTYPEIDHSIFKECDWTEFYRNTKEAIPVNAP